MTKLMIVDDEAIIRSGIRNSIAWTEYDIEVIAEAANGMDACEKALAVQPDIIITDIRMPILDGLGFIARIKEKLLHTHFILLSGYSDTEYLKQAIALGVHDYIFKNANSEEILNSVLKVVKVIENEKAARSRTIQRDNLLDENMEIIHATLMKQLLTSETQSKIYDIKCKCEDIGIALNGPCYLLACFPNIAKNKWQTIAKLNDVFRLFRPFISSIRNESLWIIFNAASHSDVSTISTKLDYITFNDSTKIHVILTTVCNDLLQLSSNYSKISQILERLFWFPNKLIDTSSVVFPELNTKQIISLERQCITNFVEKKFIQLDTDLELYFEFLKHNMVPYRIFIESITRLLSTVCVFEKNDGIMDFLAKIDGKSYDEIFATVKEQVVKELPSSDSSTCLVEKSEQYVRDHLTENPTLNEVAQTLYISPGYLSRLFKDHKGVGFKQFTYECRLEKAKELLVNSDYKNYEIAVMTGFRDYKHFSNAFLKYCGCSARDYRNSHRKAI